MKRYIFTLAAALLAACGGGGAGGVTGPGDGNGNGSNDFANLTLTPSTGNVEVGASFQLVATPMSAAGNPLQNLPAATWSSSDNSKATVANGGVVTGVAPGPVTITATVTSGSVTKTASAQLTIVAKPAVLASLSLDPADGTVGVGATLALTATPRDASGGVLTGLGTPTFTSSAQGIATVSASGVVTGVSAGTAVVTASLTSGGVTRTASANVTVTSTGGGSGGGGGGSASATVQGIGHSFSPTSVSIVAGGTVTWRMVDEEHDVTWVGAAPPGGNIGKIDEGESASRTFPEPGTYTYRCDRHENHNEGGTVIVGGAGGGGGGGGGTPAFTSVTLAPPNPSVNVGATVQLTATPRDQFGAPMSGLPAASFSSSSQATATVSATGLVTGVAAGSATITATITANGVTRSATTTVTVGGSGGGGGGGGGTAPSTATVTTPGSSFSPQTVTIARGGTVTWQITGTRHNVTFQGNVPTGGSIGDTDEGNSVSRTFSNSGTYDYVCTRHSGMTGRVIVQ